MDAPQFTLDEIATMLGAKDLEIAWLQKELRRVTAELDTTRILKQEHAERAG